MPPGKTDRKLFDEMKDGSFTALSRLITRVENNGCSPEILREMDSNQKRSFTVGITGPPGAGKSSIVNHLASMFRQKGMTLGILAVDPSSPFSGGSLLGDRIRMKDHSDDENVFIRSTGTRGIAGGLSTSTRNILKLFHTFGFDLIIIETAGAGQSELDIAGYGNTVIVVLTPESGDFIQVMKAGLMEIGDIFVVNKSDRSGAGNLSSELQSLVSTRPSSNGWDVPVVLTNANTGKGITELATSIEEHRKFLISNDLIAKKSDDDREIELRELVNSLLRERVDNKLSGEYLQKVLTEIKRGELSIYEAASLVFSEITDNPQL